MLTTLGGLTYNNRNIVKVDSISLDDSMAKFAVQYGSQSEKSLMYALTPLCLFAQ